MFGFQPRYLKHYPSSKFEHNFLSSVYASGRLAETFVDPTSPRQQVLHKNVIVLILLSLLLVGEHFDVSSRTLIIPLFRHPSVLDVPLLESRWENNIFLIVFDRPPDFW